MPGHVFVTQGSLQNLVWDLALIPTDSNLSVTPSWGRFSPQNNQALTKDVLEPTRAAFADGLRVGPSVALGDPPPVRYVDVGYSERSVTAGDEEALPWLTESIQQALDAAAKDVRAVVTTTRARPLLALPAFGTGRGGFEAVRGAAIDALLRECQLAASDEFDIAIVCLNRSDFAFLQSRRDLHGPTELNEVEMASAAALGASAREGRLSLFLGAGVSIAAGLPDFPELIRRVSRTLHRPMSPTNGEEAACAAQGLRDRDPEAFDAAVKRELPGTRGSLLHSLLASTRAAEVTTTNFDDLYEKSAALTYSPEIPGVLPWERHRRPPWILKMHGSLHDPGELVVTADQLANFATTMSPLAGVVQEQLLTRDVVFIGYSLQDPNVLTLAEDVASLLRRFAHVNPQVGTVVIIEPLGERAISLTSAMEVVDLARGADRFTPEAARRLEIFCDLMLWQAVRSEPAWQLDPRYELVEPDDGGLRSTLRNLALPEGDTWSDLRELLARYGQEPPGVARDAADKETSDQTPF